MGAQESRWSAGRKAGRRLVLVVAASVLACGGDPGTENARVAEMVTTPAEAEDGAAVDAAPAVARIELDPARPVAGARIRARARLAPSRGGKPEVAYRWQTSSGRVLAEGPELDTAGLEPGTVVEVVATPSAGERAGEPFALRVHLASEASQIALVVIDARAGKSVGSVLNAVIETTDENDGFDAVEYEWRVGGERVGAEEELDTTPFAPGDVVELRARLADESGGGRVIHAEPIVLERGAPPAITSKPEVAVENGELRYAMKASSPVPGAQLHFELLKGPDGMAVDPSSGVVHWRPAPSQRGRFDVEVAVMDQWGSGVAQAFAVQADAQAAPPASPR